MGLLSFITDPITDLISYVTGVSAVEDATAVARTDTLDAQASAEALNRERWESAQGYLNPYAGRANAAAQQLQAEMDLPQYAQPEGGGLGPEGEPLAASPYMDTGHQYAPRDMSQVPGYQAVMDESLQAAEQSAVNSGSTAYGGRRIKAAGEVGAGVQQSYYNNYMNMLQNLASPSTATNLSSMGMNQGITMGQQNIASTNTANEYMMGGAGARQSMVGDIGGAAAGVLSGAFAGGYI